MSNSFKLKFKFEIVGVIFSRNFFSNRQKLLRAMCDFLGKGKIRVWVPKRLRHLLILPQGQDTGFGAKTLNKLRILLGIFLEPFSICSRAMVSLRSKKQKSKNPKGRTYAPSFFLRKMEVLPASK